MKRKIEKLMKKSTAWKDNSEGKVIQYDFVPPENWSDDRINEEQYRIIEMLSNIDNIVANNLQTGWLGLAIKIPLDLRGALIAELQSGNRLLGIGSSGWPNEGSVVINISQRFLDKDNALSPDVHWRRLDDPHYCKEELSQIVDGIEYLIIA
jgi:hypothetical protein